MMHGREKSDLVIVAMKPANKAKEAHCGGICGGKRSGVGGAKGRRNLSRQAAARLANGSAICCVSCSCRGSGMTSTVLTISWPASPAWP
jgi:hypothetical protein